MASEKTTSKEHELQNKYMELQMIRQQINMLMEQKQAIDEKIQEINTTIDALKNLDSMKAGEEIWSTLGSGTFIRSDIKDIEKVLVAAGAGIVVRETVENAVKILESRLSEMENMNREIIEQAEIHVKRSNKLEPQLQKLAEEAQRQ